MIVRKFQTNNFLVCPYTLIKVIWMIKKFISLVKKVIFSFLLLYGLNLCINSLNIVIPINVFTLGTVTFLGVPGLVSLITLFFMTK